MFASRLNRRTALAGLTSVAATSALAKAPMLGLARPDFYRFKLGALAVATIFDGLI